MCCTGTVPPGPNSHSQEVQTAANNNQRPQHVVGQNAEGVFLESMQTAWGGRWVCPLQASRPDGKLTNCLTDMGGRSSLQVEGLHWFFKAVEISHDLHYFKP